MAVLAMAIVTAAVIAAYSATTAEVIANNAMRAQERAHQLAEAGLQQFLLRRGEPGFCAGCVADPTVADSEYTRVGLSDGYADVVATRVRGRLADGSPALFFVRSRGVDTSVRLGGAGSAVYASRTVGQYATFGTASVKPLGAFASLNGLTNNAIGSRVPVLGTDDCAFNAIAGLIIPVGGIYRGSGVRPFGIPPVDSSMLLDSLRKRLGVDWNAIVNYNAIPADVTIPPDANWPGPAFNDPSYWPVLRIRRSYSVPNDGRGIIIADSNLTLTTNDVWDGIILVGGKLTLNGSGTVSGVVLTGLNRLLPGGAAVTATDSITNTKRIQYSSCKATRAADRLRVYFAWPNTWVDNVADW